MAEQFDAFSKKRFRSNHNKYYDAKLYKTTTKNEDQFDLFWNCAMIPMKRRAINFIIH
jgi:hypothetical protein